MDLNINRPKLTQKRDFQDTFVKQNLYKYITEIYEGVEEFKHKKS